MKLMDKMMERMGYARKQTGKRMFAAANINRLTSSWTTINTTYDVDIKLGLRALRARSRDLSQNNDYARRFLKLVVINMVGPAGVKFQCKAKDPGGELDQKGNLGVENAWNEWSRRSSSDGQMSWLDIQRIVAESAARDGEILVRFIKGKQNKFGFSLQLLEADHLDEEYTNESLRIKMGIEYDDIGKPVAYHVWKNHPGDNILTISSYYERIRIPSDEIIHVYMKERPSQSRGVPWMHSAMTRLNNLGAYEEAEIVAARVGASNMGIITTPSGEEFVGEKTDEGDVIMEVEPGIFTKLPRGCDFKMFDPSHPAGNFAPFMKATLRGIAAGVNTSYNSLANDLESVNYSSLRAGSIEERDSWMTLQAWLIHNFCIPVYEAWLDMALISGAIEVRPGLKLPYTKYDKFNVPSFKGRRWQWVDPEKDINASVTAIDNKLKTRADVLAEQGLDFYEVIDQLALEEEYIRSRGLSIASAAPAAPKKPAKEEAQNAEE